MGGPLERSKGAWAVWMWYLMLFIHYLGDWMEKQFEEQKVSKPFKKC